MWSVIKIDGKCNTEVRSHIGIVKDAFEKISKILRIRKIEQKEVCSTVMYRYPSINVLSISALKFLYVKIQLVDT